MANARNRNSRDARPAGVVAIGGLVALAACLAAGFWLLSGRDPKVRAAGGPDTTVAAAPGGSTPAEVATDSSTTVASVPVTPVRSPDTVKVLVVNGTTVNKVARNAGCSLQPGGWNVLKAVDARKKVPASKAVDAVLTDPAYRVEAAQIATQLGLAPSIVQDKPLSTTELPVADSQDSSVIVVVGKDLAKAFVNKTCRPTAPSSTTVA